MVYRLDIDNLVISETYDKKVNKYGVKCGSSLESWEKSGWIVRMIHMDGFNGIVDSTEEEGCMT